MDRLASSKALEGKRAAPFLILRRAQHKNPEIDNTAERRYCIFRRLVMTEVSCECGNKSCSLRITLSTEDALAATRPENYAVSTGCKYGAIHGDYLVKRRTDFLIIRRAFRRKYAAL